MKLEGMQQVVLSKIQHFHPSEWLKWKSSLLGTRVVWPKHSYLPRCYLPRSSKQEGGFGVTNATRLPHSLNMLNNDDKAISLFVDLWWCQLSLPKKGEPGFLGFWRNPSDKMGTRSTGFWSDWPGLSDLCVRTEGHAADCSVSNQAFQIYEDIHQITGLSLSYRSTFHCLHHIQEPETPLLAHVSGFWMQTAYPVSQLAYEWRLFESLWNVHKLVLCGLQMSGMPQKKSL